MEDQRQQLESRFEITNNQLSVGNASGETCKREETRREENITRHHGLDMEGRVHRIHYKNSVIFFFRASARVKKSKCTNSKRQFLSRSVKKSLYKPFRPHVPCVVFP